ncbi:MAG TPA: hypothetical protein VKX40_12330 [Aequorivita sp.]|nr:hypothetical protein [Aequorivita sp.]
MTLQHHVAYYAAFYEATAILLNEGLDFSMYSGIIASLISSSSLRVQIVDGN